MGLFRRGPRSLPTGERTAVSVSTIRTARTAGAPTGPQAGTVQGWAGLAVLAPHSYSGAYSGSPVSMRGGMVPGLQRQCGVEGLASGWYVPPSAAPAAVLGNAWAGSMYVGNAASGGAQRVGGAPSGGMGPITVRTMRANVTRAQIQQSGMAAVQWARALSPVAGA